MDREKVIERVAEMVAYARSLSEDVEFSPEDAGRSDPDFLYVVLAEAIKAGATTLNIPDTVGYTTPDEFGALIAAIVKNTPGIGNCIVSVDRKSTRLNSSHRCISYAVFCLKKKNKSMINYSHSRGDVRCTVCNH